MPRKSSTILPPAGASPRPPKKKGLTLLEEYRALAETLEAERAAAPQERKGPLAQALLKCYAQIGKITGEGEISEASLLKSPVWVRALSVIREAVKPYPDAARAIATALAKLGGIEEERK